MRKIIVMEVVVHIVEADVEHLKVVKSHPCGSIIAENKVFKRIHVNDEILMQEHSPVKPDHLKLVCHRKVIRKELLVGNKTKLTLQRI